MDNKEKITILKDILKTRRNVDSQLKISSLQMLV